MAEPGTSEEDPGLPQGRSGIPATSEGTGDILMAQSVSLVLSLLGCVLVAVAALVTLPRMLLQLHMARDERAAGVQQQVFAKFLEQQRAALGVYPGTDSPLAEVVRRPPETVQGYQWGYTAGLDGETYALEASPTRPLVSGRLRFHVDETGSVRQCLCQDAACLPPADWAHEPTLQDPITVCAVRPAPEP